MTGADVAAMITAAGGATAAVLGGIALVRRKSGELAKAEQHELEECSEVRRVAFRVIRSLRDLLAEHGIPEPDGIDDQLRLRRRVAAGSGPDEDS